MAQTKKHLQESLGYEVMDFIDTKETKYSLADDILRALNKVLEQTPNSKGYYPSVTVLVWCGLGLTMPNGDKVALVP